MKRAAITGMALAALTLFGCNRTCVDGRACITNSRSDTVWYCWRCSQFTMALAPGATTCDTFYGEYTIDKSFPPSTVFQTASGSQYVALDECPESHATW